MRNLKTQEFLGHQKSLVTILFWSGFEKCITKCDAEQQGYQSSKVGNKINHFYLYLLVASIFRNIELKEPKVQEKLHDFGALKKIRFQNKLGKVEPLQKATCRLS